MKIKLINEIYALAPSSPNAWMVRKNGEAIPVSIHPYGNNDDEYGIKETLEAGEWLYNNTSKDATKKDVISFIASYAESQKSQGETRIKFILNKVAGEKNSSPLSKKFVISIKSEIESAEVGDVSDFNARVMDDLNNEFIRARFGGVQNSRAGSREMSFRVSSDGSVNWFDAIYIFVSNYKNKLGIKSVTIVTDEESTGAEKFYSYKGRDFNQMPVDEFLTISGNPVVEELSLDEKYAYHYGDLNVARKADKRAIMGGRGTGHFGTGFYMIGTFAPEKAYDYGKRACWEIDLDAYNLFKPRSNSQAYLLHDALKEINGAPKEELDFPTFEYFEENIIQPIYEKYFDVEIDDIAKFFNVSWDEAFDMYLDGDYKTKKNEDGKYIIPPDSEEKCKEELEKELEEEGILKYLSYTIDVNRLGELEDDIKKTLEWASEKRRDLKRAVEDLNSIFGKDVTRNVEKAIESPSQEDSKSTVFMKSLGYEGIDVTHLNKDGEGLRGPDNFTYGSVIYDLKPGTYRQIKEKDKE